MGVLLLITLLLQDHNSIILLDIRLYAYNIHSLISIEGLGTFQFEEQREKTKQQERKSKMKHFLSVLAVAGLAAAQSWDEVTRCAVRLHPIRSRPTYNNHPCEDG